jgi:hypothetical protein
VTEEHADIRQLLEQYMRCNDDRALDRLVALFAADAVLRIGTNEYVGRDAIRQVFSDAGFEDTVPHWTAPSRIDARPRSMHVLANPLIEISGDHATAESDFFVLIRSAEGGAKVTLLGRYRDRLRRDATEGWLLTERTVVPMAVDRDPAG